MKRIFPLRTTSNTRRLQQQLQHKCYSTLNFNDTKTVFNKVTTQELIESYLTLTSCQIPLVRKYGPNFLEIGGSAAQIAAKYTYFKHFCGGETLTENQQVIEKLAKLGLQSILDYSVEGSVHEESHHSQMDDNAKREQIAQVVEDSVTFMKQQNDKLGGKMTPCPFAVVKLTGICNVNMLQNMSQILTWIQLNRDSLFAQQFIQSLNLNVVDQSALVNYLLDIPRTPTFKFNEKPSQLTQEDIQEFHTVMNRLIRISEKCKLNDIGLLIDAEQSWVQPAIDLFAFLIIAQYNKVDNKRILIHNTYQLYLKDGFNRLQYDLKHLTQNHQSKLGVKLVRGAYMSSETKRGEQLQLPYLFNADIHATHSQYESAMDFTLKEIATNNSMAAVIASHNANTLLFAHDRVSNMYSLNTRDPRIVFAQLYGMGDSLSLTMANNGYNIAKYVPFGPVNEVLPYLSRRLTENGDIMSGSSIETKRMKSEICKRILNR